MFARVLRNVWNAATDQIDIEEPAVQQVQEQAPADISDLTRLPFNPASIVIANVFRNLSNVDPESNMALEARVGATIWLLTYADKYYAKSYAESFYPDRAFDTITQTIDRINPPGNIVSNEFFHWLCLLGQKVLTDPTVKFDGRVIVDDITGSLTPRWQSVAKAQQSYKLNRKDMDARYNQAQGYERLNDSWRLDSSFSFDDKFSSAQYLKVGNLEFHRHKLLEWSRQIAELEEQIAIEMEEKQYHAAYSLLSSLEKIIPLSTWKLDESVNMGQLVTNIWHKKSGTSYSAANLNQEFASYYALRIKLCLELGKNDEPSKMFDNCKALVGGNAEYDSEEKAFARLNLCQYAKQLNRLDDELTLKKQAAQDLLKSGTSTSGANRYLIPAFIVATLWQKGDIELKGSLYSLPLLEGFNLALQAYTSDSDFTDADMHEFFSRDVEKSNLKMAFGDVSMEEMRKVVKVARNQLQFESDHPKPRNPRSVSCTSLLFNPAKPQEFIDTTTGAAYQPVKMGMN